MARWEEEEEEGEESRVEIRGEWSRSNALRRVKIISDRKWEGGEENRILKCTTCLCSAHT